MQDHHISEYRCVTNVVTLEAAKMELIALPLAERKALGNARLKGDTLVIAVIAPEALHDPRGFHRAATTAVERLDAYAREREESMP